DRLVKPAHLQIQLGQRVVRIRIVRDQLDIFFEGRLSVGVVPGLAVGVTENIERARVSRSNFSRLLVMLDSFWIILLTKIVTTHIELCSFVARKRRYELIEQLLLFSGIAVRAGLIAEDQEFL